MSPILTTLIINQKRFTRKYARKFEGSAMKLFFVIFYVYKFKAVRSATMRNELKHIVAQNYFC